MGVQVETNRQFFFCPGVGCIKSVWRYNDGNILTVQAIAWHIEPPSTNAIALPTLGDSLEATNLTWTTGGSVPWFVQTCESQIGAFAARSGRITDNGESWIETTVVGPCQLSFWWKVSSETNYDNLTLYINGIGQSLISGELDWTQQTISLLSGTNAIRWTYRKDGGGVGGQDAAWLDGVRRRK